MAGKQTFVVEDGTAVHVGPGEGAFDAQRRGRTLEGARLVLVDDGRTQVQCPHPDTEIAGIPRTTEARMRRGQAIRRYH